MKNTVSSGKPDIYFRSFAYVDFLLHDLSWKIQNQKRFSKDLFLQSYNLSNITITINSLQKFSNWLVSQKKVLLNYRYFMNGDAGAEFMFKKMKLNY